MRIVTGPSISTDLCTLFYFILSHCDTFRDSFMYGLILLRDTISNQEYHSVHMDCRVELRSIEIAIRARPVQSVSIH